MSEWNDKQDSARGSFRVETPLAIIVPNFIYITQYTRAQPSTKGADIFCPKQTFLLDKICESVILLTSPTNNGNKMNVYFNITYKDGSTKQVRVRQTQNIDTLQEVLEHYRSKASVDTVILEIY